MSVDVPGRIRIPHESLSVFYDFLLKEYGFIPKEQEENDRRSANNSTSTAIYVDISQYGMRQEKIQDDFNKYLKSENIQQIKDLRNLLEPERFCNYIWLILMEIKYFKDISSSGYDYDVRLKSSADSFLYNLDIREKSKLINSINIKQNLINELLTLRVETPEIIKLITEIKVEWNNRRTKNIKWFESADEDDSQWLYDKFQKENLIYSTLSPSCKNDYHRCLSLLLDGAIDLNKRDLAIIKIKKAYSQKTYRRKNNDIKYYNIGMTDETKTKLDEMVEKKRIKIHQLIQDLINAAYSDHIKK